MLRVPHKVHFIKLLFGLIFSCITIIVVGQSVSRDSTHHEPSTFQKIRVGQDTKKIPLEIKGYYRFIGYARKLNVHFSDSNTPLVIRTDDEFNTPNFNINILARPTANSFVALQLLTFDPMINMVDNNRIFRLSRQGVVLSTGASTSKGKFKVSFGGTQFVELGDFLMSSAKQVQNSLFDRNAWTYVWPIAVQHDSYYSRSDYIREVDFGKRQLNGLRLQALDLPGLIDFEMVVGKTPFNLPSLPDFIMAGRLSKQYRLQTFHVGSMNSRGLDAWRNGEKFGVNILSLAHEGRLKNLGVKSELAFGKHRINAENSQGSGVAFKMLLSIPKRKLNFPLDVELFAVTPNFVNLHSALINTSVDGFSSETSSFNGANVQDGARPFGAVLTPMHLVANNRASARFSSTFGIGRLRINLGYLISREIQNLPSDITFYHKVTGLYMSRVDRFQSATGPNNAITTFFRGAYQRIGITSEGHQLGIKGFNAVRLNAKVKGELFERPFFIFYLGEYLSTQHGLSMLPKFGESAIVSAQYHEMDTYFPFGNRCAWILYGGLERIKGNEFTSPRDGLEEQEYSYLDGLGAALGTGIDISMTKSSTLFFRYKRVDYFDQSITSSRFQGWESTIELKIHF